MTKFTLFMFGLLSFLAAILSQAACPVLNGTYHAVASKFPFHTLNIATEQPATEQRYKFERYEIVVDGKIRSLPRTQVLTSVVAAGPVENAMTTWKVVD